MQPLSLSEIPIPLLTVLRTVFEIRDRVSNKPTTIRCPLGHHVEDVPKTLAMRWLHNPPETRGGRLFQVKRGDHDTVHLPLVRLNFFLYGPEDSWFYFFPPFFLLFLYFFLSTFVAWNRKTPPRSC